MNRVSTRSEGDHVVKKLAILPALLGVVSLITLSACEAADQSQPVSREDYTLARDLITGNGYRCERVVSLTGKVAAKGWYVKCEARGPAGNTRTEWPYNIGEGAYGWIVAPGMPGARV